MNDLPNTIITNRLILRPWKKSDLQPFAQLNADQRVREYFPRLLTEEQSNEQAEELAQAINSNGWGFWAVSVINGPSFIGFIGLQHIDCKPLPKPSIEIGWRLAYEHWGYGYATEGALASIKYAFETLHLEETLSITAACNAKSRRIMEKIHMTHNEQDDFDMPLLPEGHNLRRCVLYRLQRISYEKWRSSLDGSIRFSHR